MTVSGQVDFVIGTLVMLGTLGVNVTPILASLGVGSLAVAASDPNVIYVGSGEANIRGNVAIGTGIFKSTDAGKSWTQVWKTRGQIGTLVVHPGNPDIAYAAVLGSPFGPNAERGVYRTPKFRPANKREQIC